MTSAAAKKAWSTRRRLRHWKKKVDTERTARLKKWKEEVDNEKWIQGATNPKKKGSLRAHVLKVHGKAGFDSSGRIKVEVLKDMANAWGPSNKKVRQQAQFALNVRPYGGHSRKTRRMKR